MVSRSYAVGSSALSEDCFCAIHSRQPQGFYEIRVCCRCSIIYAYRCKRAFVMEQADQLTTAKLPLDNKKNGACIRYGYKGRTPLSCRLGSCKKVPSDCVCI